MSFTFDDSGMTKFLKNLEKKAKEISGENSIPANETFTSQFLSKHSNFTSFDDLLEKSPFIIKNQEDFKNIPDAEWEKFITDNTDFESWKDMKVEAAKEWTVKKLGF